MDGQEKLTVNICKGREKQRHRADFWKFFRSKGKNLDYFHVRESTQSSGNLM